MTHVYAVRCNFQNAELEDDWNEWYNGPKMADMLRLPMFMNVQRFAAAGLDRGVKYLALWLLESDEALQTPEYLSSWGFARWAGMIGDWSRDMIQPADPGAPVPFPLTTTEAVIHVAWFSEAVDMGTTMSNSAAGDQLWWWGRCTGLDLSSSFMGMTVYGSAAEAPHSPVFAEAEQETVYRPISAPGRP